MQITKYFYSFNHLGKKKMFNLKENYLYKLEKKYFKVHSHKSCIRINILLRHLAGMIKGKHVSFST